jgi:hypothetical protein
MIARSGLAGPVAEHIRIDRSEALGGCATDFGVGRVGRGLTAGVPIVLALAGCRLRVGRTAGAVSRSLSESCAARNGGGCDDESPDPGGHGAFLGLLGCWVAEILRFLRLRWVVAIGHQEIVIDPLNSK